jgi:hypothetical protein
MTCKTKSRQKGTKKAPKNMMSPIAKGIDMSQFTPQQQKEIELGLKEKRNPIDVSVYADPKFSVWQMRVIREGLEAGLDVSHYANPAFGVVEMCVIREGLRKGLDVSVYAKPEYKFLQMEEIRMGLEAGIDVSRYADPKLSWQEMRKIREEMLTPTEPEEIEEEEEEIVK